MTKLFGKEYSKKTILESVGNVSQICDVKKVKLTGGNREGVDAVLFKTGSGLNFSVLPGRGMDFSDADYKGIPLCWRSSVGEASGAFYESEGGLWDRNYHGGLFHTSGITTAGAPSEDEGVTLGLHGRISNTPAFNFYVDGYWEGNDYWVWLLGKVRITSGLGENLLLTRKVSAKMGENKIYLEDVVENQGHQTTPHMILYHTNFGFPLIGDETEFVAPIKKTRIINEKNISESIKYSTPQSNFPDQLFYFDVAEKGNGLTKYAVINRTLNERNGLGISIEYSKHVLPNLLEWKKLDKAHYVVEIGPTNAMYPIGGRKMEREQGTLKFLKAGEKVKYEIEFEILDTFKKIEDTIQEIKSI